jgi:predicted nucleotidyltransferase
MIDEQAIRSAAEQLLAAAGPGAELFLFGSRARGDADDRSDVDFLVIEPQVEDVMAEMVRLTEVLAPGGLPADVVVMSRERFNHWKDTPNTLAYRVTKEGKIYARVA